MNLELINALEDLEREKGISKEILLDAIETAVVSAYKRNYGTSSSASVRVEFNRSSGEIRVFARRNVVEEVEDETVEIGLEEAQALDPEYQVGDVVENEVTPTDFGRIAAQTAKQVIIQKIREAERSIVFDTYANREGDVVTGTILRSLHRQVIVDLGDVEAVLPISEQIPNERYEHNSRQRFYINEVKQSSRGAQVFLSRTHPGLLKALFELEVPEIQSGEVEIKSVAREAGNRSKLAVYSRDPAIDPVGACVGARGVRVQAVVAELNNERIDVVEWVNNTEEFIKNALSPARVLYVRTEEETKTAHTVVPNDQLSLAIGKEGQNARLAARLTGWKIDIKSLEQAEDFFAAQPEPVEEEAEVEKPAEMEEPAEVEEPITAAEAEKVESPEPALAEISEADLAGLTNIAKRKSWQERFGAIATESESEAAEEAAQNKQETEKEKEKKKEKVITDLSQLDSIDFKFEEKK
ncbi:MAG TPA: transcription termination/antitermination protein NusA [Firmicutes bacterium]|nr:transcription termination/antitermination protein NusA [Bacillota bacterium]